LTAKTENSAFLAEKSKSFTVDMSDRKLIAGMRYVVSDAVMRLQTYQIDLNNRQRMGLALSSAAPSQPFDILLRA